MPPFSFIYLRLIFSATANKVAVLFCATLW